MLLIDPDGMDLFYHTKLGRSGEDPTWNWHEGSTYDTGVKGSDDKTSFSKDKKR